MSNPGLQSVRNTSPRPHGGIAPSLFDPAPTIATSAAAAQDRPYQIEARKNLSLKLWKRPILVMPTGAGKTQTAVSLVISLNGSCLWIAHRRELIHQAARHLRRYVDRDGQPLRVGVIMAGEESDRGAKVHVASIQTLSNRQIPAGAQLIIVDEAHHSCSESYESLFELGLPVVGLTATPFRLDGRPLDMFGDIVIGAYADELIRDGFLIAPRVFSGATPDLHGVTVRMGDYVRSEVENRIDQPYLVGDVIRTWQARKLKECGMGTGNVGDTWNPAGGPKCWRTICFAASIGHSQHLVAAFNSAGVQARHLDGTTPKDVRDQMLADLAEGRIEILSNYGVLTEGWDLPALECAIIARPTASLSLHCQMIGRVLRPADGKRGACILDHAGNHHRHGPVTRRLEYSLSGSVKTSKDQPLGALGMRRCEACLLLVDVRAEVCPDCGAAMPVGAVTPDPLSRDGELVEYDDTKFPVRAAFWAQVKAEQQSLGRSDGWAAHRFNERFGSWPVTVPIEQDGQVVEQLVDPTTATREQKQAVFEALTQKAKDKNFKPGWASWKFKEQFGVWPSGFVREVREAAGVVTSPDERANALAERWRR